MKKSFLFLSLLMVLGFAKAQSVKVKDLSRSVGSWEGKLTYVDYSTGNPFTMLANIKIGLTKNNMGYIMDYEYPKEPQANSSDTTFIVGKFFGKDKIVEFKEDSDGEYKMITELDGYDGNDNKKAVLRHTYIFKSNTYLIIKDVKFEGTAKWIKRNEYLLNRIENK